MLPLILHVFNSVFLLQDAYSDGSVFHRLVHLKICTCATEWLNLLMCVLRDSPKLRAIKLRQVLIFHLKSFIFSSLVFLLV